jgi:hypothetical protein
MPRFGAQLEAEVDDPFHHVPTAIPYKWDTTGRCVHMDSLETVTSKLKEIQEAVQALGDDGTINEGRFVTLSNQLRDVYGAAEELRREAHQAGAMSVGFCALLHQPEQANVTPLTSLLCDRGFCLTLLKLKIEQLRIIQGNPGHGAVLDLSSTVVLEMWGKELTDGAMKAWGKLTWGWQSTEELCDPNWAGTPRLVPRHFAMTVCNLIAMRLNLWPTIKTHLDALQIRGRHMFPIDTWCNPIVNEMMLLEPRCISFVADAGHIDMNELARSGPIRRSDTARPQLDTLTPNQRRLLHNGVEHIHTYPKKTFPFQGIWWEATIHEWPREQLPDLDDLLAGMYW